MEQQGEILNLYAAPASALASVTDPSLRLRFWGTCFTLAVVLICGFMAFPAPSMFLLVGMVWPFAAYWVLLPYLRYRSTTNNPWDVTYIACTILGIPICTMVAVLGILIAVFGIMFVTLIIGPQRGA